MVRSMRLILVSLVTLALSAPAFAYNVVNTSWTFQCLFSSSCSVSVTDYVYDFPVSGGSGNGRLQSRVFQGQTGTTGAGKWVYEYRINMTPVGGLTYMPYADMLAIENWGAIRQYDFNGDGIATDEVFNITSGGTGTRPVTASWYGSPWTFFQLSPVYSGNYPGGGESSYFFGLVSDRAPVLRYMWVRLDSGWVLVEGYAPPLP